MIVALQVFLFDEPLSNLDAKLRVQMRHEIRRIHASVGATSVFVTHDQHEGMTLADRLVIMNKGTIEQIGTPEDIYDRPASAYVAGFIGSPAMNFLPGRISGDGASVDLDDGQRIALRSGFKAAAGQLVQVGLRPEKLSFAQDGRAMLKARFDFSEELGAGRIYHMKIEDVSISLISPEKHSFTEGAEIGLGFMSNAVHLFDGVAGLRMEPGVARAPELVSV